MRSWVDGSEERMWKPSSMDPFESVEAQIISGERKVMGVMGRAGDGDELGIAVSGSGGQDSHGMDALVRLQV